MNITYKVLAFKTKAAATDFAIKKWAALAEDSVKTEKRFTAAVSGGGTPQDFYRKLGMQKNLPWDRTHIFLVDERFVPFNNAASNFGMIKESLIKNIHIPTANIHPIDTAEDSPDISATKYEAELNSFFALQSGEFPVFDLIILGVGEDGHTASLFPNDPAIFEEKRLAVAASNDKLEHKRVTISLPLINNARNIIFLVTGKNKAPVIKEILEKHQQQLPAARVMPQNGELFFILGECYG